jgi:hypothetical protein
MIKVYESIDILIGIVLYGCENRCVKRTHAVKIFKNDVLKIILLPKREEVTVE